MLLVRDDEGVLHAFANTCRHRGHELLPCGAAAQQKVIICPYHSWTYGLDGSLRAAAGFKNQPGFAAEQWGLNELPVTEWHGLVFVDGSGSAPPLADALGTLEEIVAPYEMERLVVAGQHDYETTANWKILTENYHECYHCPTIHPELCKVSPPRSGENYSAPGTWVGGWMDLREGMATMSLDGASHGAPLRGLDEKGLRTVIYVAIFPNVLLSLHPDYVMVHRLVPLAADRTQIECTWAFAPESLARPGFDPALRDRVLGHHQPAGLARVRVGAARPELAARGAGAALAGGGRGLPVRHHGRPRLPGPAGLEPGPAGLELRRPRPGPRPAAD